MARAALSVATCAALSCAAGNGATRGAVTDPRGARSLLDRESEARDASATSAAAWSVIAVSLVDTSSVARWIDGADGVDRWVFGGLRAKADNGELSIVGEPVRAPIAAAAPLEPGRTDTAWLFVTEDGAAWVSRSFDGPLERLARESAMRLQPIAPRSFGALALFGRDRTLFFADKDGLRRAPEVLEEPVISAAFADAERGFVLEAPGRVLETTDGGRSFRRRRLARTPSNEDAALSMEIGGASLVVRTAQGWLELGPDASRPAQVRQAPLVSARSSRTVASAAFARAALFEPSRGRALALSLGATLLRDGTLALVDANTAEIVLVPADRGASRVEAPCDHPALHPFGDRVIVECLPDDTSDDPRARYFVSSARGFEPLGRAATRALAAIDPSRVHIASDGSGVVIDGGCDELESAHPRGHRPSPSLDEPTQWCVLDGHHSPRTREVEGGGHVIAIAAGRVLFRRDRSIDERASLEPLLVTELSRDSSVELPASLASSDATLAPDGAIVATVLRGAQRRFVRLEPGRSPVINALPVGAERIVVVDASRVIAVGYAPLRLWESSDRGERWTPVSPGIDGVSSAPDELDRRARERRARWLGAAASAATACGPVACDLGDGLVFARRSWLAAPPLRAATAVSDEDTQQRSPRPTSEPRAQMRPPEQVWFCGAAPSRDPRAAFFGRPRSSAAPRAQASSDVFGSPGSRGWLTLDVDGARARARWTALDGERVLGGASTFTQLSPLASSIATAPTAPVAVNPPPPIVRLRLATRSFAVIERCAANVTLGASDAPCELAFARDRQPIRALGVVGDWLSGERWTGRLHAVEALDDGGFAAWITRPEPTVDTDSVEHAEGADAVLVFDARGQLTGSRVYAWAPWQWPLRGLAWDGREAGIAAVDPRGALRFFSVSAQRDGRELGARFGPESGPCAAAQPPRPSHPWIVTSERGWTPFVYARGRAAPIELGARARWSLSSEVACFEELRVDPVDDRPSALQRALDAALVVRPALGRDGVATLEATFVAGRATVRDRCSPR